jgi:hypothetical protein
VLALVLSVVAQLAAQDPAQVASAVRMIESEPIADGDELLAAARACEERLADPARALALYERVLGEAPDARAAVAAGRRASELRAELGEHGEYAAEATALARLVAHAAELPPRDVEARADALAAAAWPGAAGAALWLAEWEPRCGDARPRFEAIVARWPGSREASSALRGAATCALAAHAWADAEALAAELPADDAALVAVRADLRRAAARGRLRDRLYVAAWLVLAAVLGGLVTAFARATRGASWRARLRPPIEAVYAAPVVAALIATAAVAQPLFAPAVALVSGGGYALAWLSGAGLAARRAAGHATRARSLAHAAACTLAVLALAYIAVTRAELVDPVLDTLRFGPD